MRGLAWLILLLGPLLSAPAAAGLWMRAHLADAPSGDLYAIGAVVAVLAVEALLLRRPGLRREAAVLVLSAFWAGWLWLGLTQTGYDWSRLPAWRIPNRADCMVGIMLVLIYLAFYGLAETAAARRPRLT